MGLTIAVTRERREGETRCAVTPDTVKALIKLGAAVTVEAGTGAGSYIPDADYAAAGATVAADTRSTLEGADIVLKVRGPTAQETSALKPGAIVVADNVKFPGAPKYREYMHEHEGREWRTTEHATHVEYQSLIKDLVLESEYLGSNP